MGRCISPFRKKDSNIDLPCGKCYECKMRRVSSWSFRVMKEAEISVSAFFVTLTYDEQKVPITPNGFMTVKKRDLQLFLKRLRKRNQNKLKYYAVSEYGGKTERPHYHIILFNADVETIEDSWQNGQIHVGELTEASAGYTMKYISKGGKIPKHERDDRVKEFSVMSKKLGANYLTPAIIKWHKTDLVNRVYIGLKDGKKIALPRYFKDKLYNEMEKNTIAWHMSEQECLKDVDKTRQQIVADMEKEDKIRHNKGLKAIKRYESL